MERRVTAIKITKAAIHAKIDGHPTSARIQYNQTVPMVGHYKRGENVILIDKKIIDPKERNSIAVHELTERHFRYQQGLPKTEAHRIAQREEGRYDRQHSINVSQLNRNVESVFRKNRRPGCRRRR